MKKFFTASLVILLLINFTATAQVKIGNTGAPVSSAMLELSGTNRGLLLSQVDLPAETSNSLTTYGLNGDSPREGMMVYNTNATAPFTIGTYIWQNSEWVKIIAGTDAWRLTGNTVGATDFLGTLNSQPLRFKVNNLNAGIIDSTLQNTALGVYALNSITTGQNNVALGFKALQGNTTGNSNIAIGDSALAENTTGNNNTAIGSNANVASNNLTNATAIGANAYVEASNALVLGSINGENGATADVNVGIGTTKPGSSLTVNGSFAPAYNNITATSYALTTTDYYVGWSNASPGTFTLPNSGPALKGRIYTIKNNSASSDLTINAAVGETIAGVASVNVPAGATMQLVNNGAIVGNAWDVAFISFNTPDVAISNLKAAKSVNAMDNTSFAQTWSWSSATTETPLTISAPNLTSGIGLHIDVGSTLTTGNALNVTTTSGGGFTNGAVRFNYTGNHTGTGFLIQDVTTTGTVQSIIASTLTTGVGLNINAGASLTNGNALNVTTTSTGSFSSGAVRFNYTGNHTGSGFVIQDATTAGTAQTINVLGLITGNGLNINAGGGLTSGSVLNVTNFSGGNFTNGAVRFFSSGTHTGTGVMVLDATNAGTAQSIITTALNTGIALNVNAGGGLTSGNALNVNTSSAGNFSTGAVRFDFTGNHTGAGFLINDATITGTVQSVTAANLTTGTGLLISTSSPNLNSTSGLFRVQNTGASVTGILAGFQANSTVGSGMTILTNGNIGIGTASPLQKLHIKDGHIRSEQTTLPGSSVATGNGITAVSLGTNSTDTKGRIIATGANNTTNLSVIEITFNQPATTGVRPIVTITPANDAARQCTWFVSPSDVDEGLGFKLNFIANIAGLTDPQFNYIVID